MTLSHALEQFPLILAEGSLIERLRRDSHVAFDPHVLHAGFVYSDEGRKRLETLYRSYLDLGCATDLPMIVLTPTWRANPEAVRAAGLADRNVNADGFRFVDSLRRSYGDYAQKVLIGGLIGCKGDAYRASDALSESEAEAFHNPQLRALAESGVDFLMAATLPAFSEALGIARAMARTDTPYILSFVMRRTGLLLDGTTLSAAVAGIDDSVVSRPLGYMINCVHPVSFVEALRAQLATFPALAGRVLGLQANTSRKEPEELEGLEVLDEMEPDDFGRAMVSVHRRYGVKILGGCCGTDNRHIAAIARHAAYEVTT